ncbi:MAG: NINE protein [Candidatus Heimdallarchaeota archaeon]
MENTEIDVSRKKKNYKIGIILCSSFAVLSLAYLIWYFILITGTAGYELYTVLEGNPYALLSTLFEIITYVNLYVLLILIVTRVTLLPLPDPTLSKKTFKIGIILSTVFTGIYSLFLLITALIIVREGTGLDSLDGGSFWGTLFYYCLDGFSLGGSVMFYVFSIVNYVFLAPTVIFAILLPVFLVLRSGKYQQWKVNYQQRKTEKKELKQQHLAEKSAQELESPSPTRQKSRLTAFLLCFFLGDFGAHRFYVGRTKSALLWLFTFGLFNVGSFVDLIMILSGSFRDAQGNLVSEWDPAPSKASVAPSSLSSLASSSPTPPPPPPVSSPQEVEIIYCPHCSAKNRASQQFCGSCGERLVPITR